MNTAAVLLTGATGAIGRPLADALLARGVPHVWALTHRAGLTADSGRITVIRGDVTAGPALGIERDHVDRLQATIGGIVHAAALTSFGAPLEDSRRVNHGGTRNVLAFAARCATPPRIVALSTTHVAGRRTGDIFEDDLEHDAGFVNAYEASKYDAERELSAHAGQLPIAICRLSTVAGDSRTGTIGRKAALHQAALLIYSGLVPMVPGHEDSPVDLIALEYAVAAIATLATSAFAAGRTYHICAGADTIAAGELIDLTLECFQRCRPAWRKRAIARPAFVDLATFELFRRSVEQIGDAALRAATSAVSSFAPQLAFPKRFDDRHCAAALAHTAIRNPPIRDTWPQVVRQLIAPSAMNAAVHGR